jgi:ferritin-like metal-binding protein YciE
MASPEERLMEWLRDAHAMEEQAEQMLSMTSQRLKDYPDLRSKLVEHLEETRRQAITVRGCIERRGGSISLVKELVAKTTAVAQGLSGLFVSDEVVKALLAVYTFENMEIASYKVLIATADQVGDTHTRQACEAILAEEQAMADWVGQQLAPTTSEYLSRERAKAA